MSCKLNDSPLPEIIRGRLPDSLFTRHVYYLPLIGSTNDYAKELAQQGVAEGAMMIAEKQTKGKGRIGRQWHSPSKVNLLFLSSLGHHFLLIEFFLLPCSPLLP